MSRSARAVSHVIDIAPPTAAWARALPRLKAIVRKAAEAALRDGPARLPARHPLRRSAQPLEVSILLAGDALVRRLNCDYRRKDRPTNVLSFPTGEEAYPLLGDVVLAYGVAKREAASENKTLAAHTTHLVVHGVLHLLGYDHHVDEEAALMERLEITIMARLGFADPYGPSASEERRGSKKSGPRTPRR